MSVAPCHWPASFPRQDRVSTSDCQGPTQYWAQRSRLSDAVGDNFPFSLLPFPLLHFPHSFSNSLLRDLTMPAPSEALGIQQ